MSNDEYLNKINFLKTLNSDFYVKKEKFNSDKIIYHKQIIVTSMLKENHEENIEKFLSAAKGFYPQIEINFLNSNDNNYSYCAIGGDGTINSLIDVLLKMGLTKPIVGCLPSGSGSDFLRTFAIPQDIEKAIKYAYQDIEENKIPVLFKILWRHKFPFC